LPRLVAGVEDAGRGPVIGPLVIAGVLIEEDRLKHLEEIGVRDSKLLTPLSRKRMAAEIVKIARGVAYEQISPSELDLVVHRAKKLRRLNYLEAKAMARVIEHLRPDIAFVDASDVKENRFGTDIASMLPPELKGIKIVSKHHADRDYPVVSAASILAKVKRDEEIEKLKAIYGDFGSGYSNDPKTISFLREWRLKHLSFPPIARRSWRTLKAIEDELR
jgi:ribonuclease HII